jgi:HK97 family phage major capsid protein
MHELREKRDLIEDELLVLADKEVLTAGENERWTRLSRQLDSVNKEMDEHATRAARIEEIERKADRFVPGSPGRRPFQSARLSDHQDAALRSLDRLTEWFSVKAAANQEEAVREDPYWAARFAATSTEAYSSAFAKYLIHGEQANLFLTDEERAAMSDAYEARALAEGATTTGGFAVPVHLDPSLILTNQESDNVMLRTCRVEDITTPTWKGISAAGMSWSFDAEAEEVSDDSITLAQPTVDVFMARGFIPYSIEVSQDWPGFQNEMARLLATGYDELLLDRLTLGSGVGEPRGLITALDTSTNSEVVVTTDGAFGQEDVYHVWERLPQKARRRASWMMSVGVMDRIRQMGEYNQAHSYTVNLPQGAIGMLFARQVVENAYFPDFTATTGHANLLVVGDLSAYVIARRSGLSVEVVPHLVGQNNRPTGQRGMFAFARVGGNVVDPAQLRLLQNV